MHLYQLHLLRLLVVLYVHDARICICTAMDTEAKYCMCTINCFKCSRITVQCSQSNDNSGQRRQRRRRVKKEIITLIYLPIVLFLFFSCFCIAVPSCALHIFFRSKTFLCYRKRYLVDLHIDRQVSTPHP